MVRVESTKYKVLHIHDLGVRFKNGTATVPENKIGKLQQMDADGRYGFLFVEPEPSLESKTKSELEALLVEQGVEVPAKAKKVDLIALLEAQEG